MRLGRGGSHYLHVIHPDGSFVRIPSQHGREFRPGTLRAILEQAGLEGYTEDDIRSA